MHRAICIFCLAAATTAAAALPPAEKENADDVFAANKRLGRGVNLGNALEAPKEGDWGVKLKAEYFRAVKDAGFAMVRLPIKWSARAAADAPYTIDAAFAERVD